MEEYSYTSNQPLGHTGSVTGSLYLYLYLYRKGDHMTSTGCRTIQEDPVPLKRTLYTVSFRYTCYRSVAIIGHKHC